MNKTHLIKGWLAYWIISFLTGLLVPGLYIQNIKANTSTNSIAQNITLNESSNITSSKNYLLEDKSNIMQTCIYESPGTKYPAYSMDNILTLIDKSHFIDDTYAPNNLVAIKKPEFPVNGTLYIRESILPDLKDMISAMQSLKYNVYIKSAWRLPATQQRVFNTWVSRVGYEKAKFYAAEPYHSEHHLGTTIDIGFKNTTFFGSSADLWLRDNAHNYGFVMSYQDNATDSTGYSFEPWHYRYVGKDIAKYLYENKITLSDYLYDLYNICKN